MTLEQLKSTLRRWRRIVLITHELQDVPGFVRHVTLSERVDASGYQAALEFESVHSYVLRSPDGVWYTLVRPAQELETLIPELEQFIGQRQEDWLDRQHELLRPNFPPPAAQNSDSEQQLLRLLETDAVPTPAPGYEWQKGRPWVWEEEEEEEDET